MTRPPRATALLGCLLAALVAVLPFMGGAAADVGPPPAPDESLSVASQAAGWLAGSQIRRDGAIHLADRRPDAVATGWAALALRAAGLVPESARPSAWLERHVDALAREDDQDSPAGLAMLILVAVSENRSPQAFGGQDLVARLLATRQDDGRFGPADALPVTDPVGGVPARQGLVLSALGAAGRSDAGAAEWLEALQCPSGGWQFQRTDPDTRCRPTPEVTGYALQGLAALGRPTPASAIDALAGLEQDDGTFGRPGTAGNAFGTALAIQGLLAAGQDPNDPRWRKGAGADAATPFFALLRFATDPSGAFSLAPNGPPDASLTARVVLAAAGQTLPLSAATDPMLGDGDGIATPAPDSSDSASSSESGGTTTGSEGFSPVVLLGLGAGVAAVVASIYVYRRRRQAL